MQKSFAFILTLGSISIFLYIFKWFPFLFRFPPFSRNYDDKQSGTARLLPTAAFELGSQTMKYFFNIREVPIKTLMPISYQSLNGANSGSRGPREEVKKGKSSKVNPPNYEQAKSSPAHKVWSHEGSNLYPRNG